MVVTAVMNSSGLDDPRFGHSTAFLLYEVSIRVVRLTGSKNK